MSAVATHFANHRIAWSRAVLVLMVLLVVLGSPPKALAGWPAKVSELLGFAMLVVAALWRIWCLVFIGGAKNGELTSGGPFSVVRNPLYVGNFLGAVGFGLAIQQPLAALGLGLLFSLSYRAIIAREEHDLARIFGERYNAYCAAVPRWIPDWSLYREPESVTLAPRHIRKGILDAMWFLWAFAIWKIVEELHLQRILPTLF